MLKFGDVSDYLGYNAMQDFFPKMTMKPNDACDDSYCRIRQEEHKKFLALNPVVEEAEKKEVAVVHEENDWGTVNLF